MTKIGRLPIILNNKIKLKFIKNIIYFKSLLGELNIIIPNTIKFKINKLFIKFEIINNSKKSKMMCGTIRSKVQNIIYGLTNGFEKKIILKGVGYKFKKNNNIINLFLGFSHKIDYLIPKNITCKIISFNELLIKGIDKELVNKTASEIKSLKKSNIYKGKGIYYYNEKIILKERKKK